MSENYLKILEVGKNVRTFFMKNVGKLLGQSEKMSEFEKYSEKCQEQNLKNVRILRNVRKLQKFYAIFK